MRAILYAAAACCLVCPTLAAAQAENPTTIMPKVMAATAQPMARGQLIYSYDQAAWHGTDDMLAKITKPEERIGGWIVDGPAEAPQLTFYDRDKAEPHRVYVARFEKGRLIDSHVVAADEDRLLTARQRQMVAARDAAIAAFGTAKPVRCTSQAMNSVVIPGDADGSMLVYLLAPQPDPSSALIGGNYRIEVSADGRAGEPHAFARSCIAAQAGASQQGQAAGIVLTHLLDPVPTEIHVFASSVTKLPIFVMTTSNKHLWRVESNRIGLLSEDIEKGRAKAN